MVSRKQTWSWVLYDWANSAFATTVMAGFFPIFFKLYYSHGADAVESTAQLGLANSLASLSIALAVPLLGAVADAGGYLRAFLFVSTLLGAVFTAALAFVGQGEWFWAAAFYCLANLGFGAAIALNDAMLPLVSDRSNADYVSALGYAFGYLGGGVLFAVNVLMYLRPGFFGITEANDAIRYSFISVAVWWIVFAIPCLLFVRERPSPRRGLWLNIRTGMQTLAHTMTGIRRHKVIALYLLAFFLYNDAVGTTIRMALDYGMSLGFDTADLITALLLVQFVGFPCAYLFGIAARRTHPKPGIYAAIAMYIVILLWAMNITAIWEFYAIAVLIGTVQGGIQALSRSYYLRLIPVEQSGQFYGFYNLLGKFTGLLGPALMGWAALSTGSSRVSLLPVIALLLLGAFLLHRVKE